MGKRLYVGNLSYQTTDADLQELFAGAGAVSSAEVVQDRDTGRSKGFGFVEMENDGDAAKAITQFDGSTLHDRQIKVNEARPREERGGGGRGGFGGGFGGGGGGRGGSRGGSRGGRW
jgi:RNA recognition motif-containing protein